LERKKFRLGKFLEHPEIMTQGLTLEELDLNLKDAYMMMAKNNQSHVIMKLMTS
jgi:predicted RNase H-like HicB family nuclease